MKPVPKSIQSSEGNLSILWSDGHAGLYAARDLRLGCRCAACIDEWTHESRILPEQIPLEVKVRKIEVVGSYALHFTWSDGHDTGIYSYDYLREVCGCAECRKAREFSV